MGSNQQSPSTTSHNSAILTLTEAARHLRCSRAHLSHILHGKLPDVPPPPIIRLGRRVLIRADAMSDWLSTLEHRERDMQRMSGLWRAPIGRGLRQ